MARTLSAEDKRILAEIKAEQAARKKSKGGAKDLQKELKDAKAKRKTPKFNSKGQLTANAEEKKPAAKKKVVKKPEAKKKKPVVKKKVVKKPEAKKPVVKKPAAKKPAAKKKVAKKKVAKKKVNISRGKPVPVTNPNGKAAISQRTSARGNAASTGSKAVGQVDPNNKTGKQVTQYKRPIKDVKGTNTTVKPKAIPDGTKIGPAGERHGSSAKPKSSGKFLSRLLKGGAALTGGPLAAIAAGATLYNMVNPDKTKARSGKSKAGFGTKKKKQAKTSAATATSAASASQTSSESTQGASSSSSFGAAFKKARASGVSKFTWKGKSYSTATKDDVKKSGSKNLREHLNKQNKKSK
jgi:hypothetical protein